MATNARAIFLSAVLGLLVAVGLFASVLVLSFSWIKLVVLGAALVGGFLFLFLRGTLRKIAKYFLVAMVIFALSFTSTEFYMFGHAGYPPTYSASEPTVTLSFQGLMNASLTQILQGIEQSPTFGLLKLEHGDRITFESMNLEPGNGSRGYLRVDFATENSNSYFHFYSSNGHQYIVKAESYSGQLQSQRIPLGQSVEETFAQIDSLGIRWFYNRALEIAQNRTANLPSADSLAVSITYEDQGIYQGITLQLTAFHETVSENGSVNGHGIIIADFQPNGTLIYMTQPSP